MSNKISRAEYLENIHNIINEGMADNVSDYSGSDRFNISRYIAALIEEGHNDPRLMNFLINWQDRISGNEDREYQFYRSFAEGLGAFATGNMSVRKVLNDIEETLANFGHELEIYCNIDLLPGYDRENCRLLYDDYLCEPSDIGRSEFIESLMDAYNNNVEAAHRIMNLFADESLADTELRYKATNESLDEYARVNRKIAKAREERKIKKVQEKLTEYANSLFEQARLQREEEREANSLAGMANNNGLNLSEAIRSIASSDASKNKKLMETIDQYAGAIRSGLYEERLYETFLKNLRPFEYLQPVEKATKKIYETASKNATRINITKLLEEMSESSSYQLLPLIEEACARFAKNPTPNNRVQARQCLMQFAHDPYCYAILEAIDNDNSKEANTLEEQVMTIKDTAKLIREKASTSPLYSPVQYIKEGECVFYANGTYFVKKNNAISKLGAEHVNQLSEKFVTLCKLVNDPAVQILENKIILTGTDKIGEIYEGYVDINKNRESAESLRNLQEMCMKYDFDTNFFIMCSCLLENFNNIAKINFGTHIALNSDPGVNVDMFRLGDNIFINTVNENMMTSTFFHNVNPIQCKNIINSHMGINVAAMFENLLPNQSKIMLRLNETKEEYMNSINKLESTIDKLEAGKKKCSDKSSIEKLDDNIKKAKEQLEEVKNEYKKWQEKVGEQTEGTPEKEEDDDEVNGDGATREETTSEPLDDKEVDAQIDELSTPIDGAAPAEVTPEDFDAEAGETDGEGDEVTDDAEADEDPFNISDDEFEQFITDEEPEDEAGAEAEEPADEDPDLTNEINDFLDDNAEDEPADEENPVLSVSGETDDATDAEVDAIINDEIEGAEAADDNAVDSGFEELPVEDDTIADEVPAEEIESDEDVILPEDAGDEATDMFGGDTEDPVSLGNTSVDQTNLEGDNVNDVVSSQSDIVAVMFDENIKTGEKYRSGYVSVVTPMVTATGDLYNDMKNYKFYIDQDGNPVIDGEAMSAALYNGIVDKIKAEPLYDVFVKEGVDKKITAPDVPVGNTKVLTVDNTDEDPLDFEDADNDELDDFLKTTDLPDEFSVSLDFEDPVDDEPAEPVVPEDQVDYNVGAQAAITPAAPESDNLPFIPTYKSGDTEIELPTPDADGSVIPESKETPKKPAVNEARKAIKGIKSVLNRKKESGFFVNEDSGKSSKMKRHGGDESLNEEIAGATGHDVSDSIPVETDCLLVPVHTYTENLAASAARVSGHRINVSEIAIYIDDEESIDIDKPYFFTVENMDDVDSSVTVYSIRDNIYVRPTSEFEQIRADFVDEVPLQLICSLESEYLADKQLNHVSAYDRADWEFMLKAYVSNMAGIQVTELEQNSELNERCKIRKAKLSAGHDYLNSKHVDDILHGDEEEREFKDDVEKDTQAAGVENPLAPSQPAQEEAYVPVLPNVNRAQELMENYDIIFETNDKVLYKSSTAEVINVSEDEKSATIKLKDGSQKTVPMSALEPDPEYVNDLNFDDTSDKSMLKDNDVTGQDLDAHTVDCDIVVDGHKINIGECWANINDIKNSKKTVRVLTEEGFVNEFDINQNLSFKDFPYAVVVDAAGEPIRKIQIDPQAYVNATDDEPVRCICGGKETAFLKRTINILS